MRKLLAVLLCSAPLYMQAQLLFKITGKIGALNAPAKIVLGYADSSDNFITDSVVLRNGRFEFSGRVAYPVRASLVLYRPGARSADGQPDILTLYLDGDPVTVISKDSVKNAIVKGSKLNEQYTNLKADLKRSNKNFTAVVKQFIADNPGSYLSLEMLPMAVSFPYKPEELEPVFNTLVPAVRNTAAGEKMADLIIKLKTINVGSLAPDFVQNDTSGVPVKLSSFRGKYVLVDFWASWCHPCRADNPHLVKSFNKYKDKNFTVLGVSLDRPNDREKWLKAIHDDGLIWTNVSDLAYWKNAAAKLYGVNAIPQNYLVDPSGKIIAQNLHGEALDKKLNEILQTQVDSLVKVIESRTDSVKALRAYLDAMGGTTDEAVAQFNTWMKKWPQSPSFPYVLGEAYYKKRERPKVIENWLKVLDMNRQFENIEKRWPIVVKSDWDVDIPVTPNTIDSLKRVIAAHPDSLLPVRQYVFAAEDEEAILQQLDAWEKQFPRSAAIPLAMGMKFYNEESPKAKPWLLKAAALQPGNAAVWVMLHLDAERWGDRKAAHEYMGKASAAAPENPNYAYYYVRYYEDTDTVLWRAKIYELAKRFPNDERGAQGLYELAVHASDTAGKIRGLEQLRALYDPGKFGWSKSGMGVLYDLYMSAGQTVKAKALAKSMGTGDGWEVRQSLVLKATIMHQNGQTQAAYDSLIAVESKSPDDMVRSALTKFGAALKKSNDEVEKEIWQAREKFISKAPPFELGLYTSDKKAALADYKGKVVLLTFWFPGCGPCRAEFPHFENVLKKFRGKDVVYLAVNVIPRQDDYVLPFQRGNGYSFIPLRGTAEWAAQSYGVSGEPANFLIDGEGRIVFSNFYIDENNERTLELMIASMLARG